MTLTTPTAPATPAAPARARSRTPGKLRIATAVTIVASLLFGLVGLQAGLSQAAALSTADADTRQLVGVQDARNALVSADATATNAFLVGGLEPAEQRAQYDASIAAAANLLAQLSGANSADAALLGEVTASLTTYTGLVEQARANNRQGFPVGSAYLEQASSVLRSDMLPRIDALVDANSARVDSSFGSVTSAVWLFALCILFLAVLIYIQVWLAKRTHRRLNAGLFTGSVILLIGGALTGVALGSAATSAEAVKEGDYRATVAVSQAYASATDAKSMESFTLIKRGSGQAFEESYVTSVASALDALDAAGSTFDSEVTAALSRWNGAHEEIRALDDGGDWDGAVALATSTEEGSPGDLFASFATLAEESIDRTAADTHDALAGTGTLSSVAGWLILIAGLLTAVLGWRGLSIRLKEYR